MLMLLRAPAAVKRMFPEACLLGPAEGQTAAWCGHCWGKMGFCSARVRNPGLAGCGGECLSSQHLERLRQEDSQELEAGLNLV